MFNLLCHISFPNQLLLSKELVGTLILFPDSKSDRCNKVIIQPNFPLDNLHVPYIHGLGRLDVKTILPGGEILFYGKRIYTNEESVLDGGVAKQTVVTVSGGRSLGDKFDKVFGEDTAVFRKTDVVRMDGGGGCRLLTFTFQKLVDEKHGMAVFDEMFSRAGQVYGGWKRTGHDGISDGRLLAKNTIITI